MSKRILFLCSGNYYRSRFAEILFNHLAAEQHLDWRADSRGIVAGASQYAGPISPFTVQALDARNISMDAHRDPLQLSEEDLARADRVIALYEREHLPMMREYFPVWLNRIEYWHVPDLDEMSSDQALATIEQNIRDLIHQLK
ncbi:MAG TPA: low molecular weight phosphatase family protein [Anaerolineae bacterium]|nr:low molecular weight phosphatase family protein [Anaerolineae bacterium]